ncbi:hypothetical protein M407DRAFT_241323 [Tulasnella calospora MUT 4182]|uniref:Uncharacterized protein n=1 Tax=Tulasnella calospora MUT 4182 TaxID=1051891 RepID=A0A0C3QVF0_9AGAM|nr:hypothetical protein M407DRAFT_241323 [Tulasnella calospora MUT 4182]
MTFSFLPTLVSGLSIFFYSRLGFRSPMLKPFRLSVSVRDRFSLFATSSRESRPSQKQKHKNIPFLFFV